MISLYQIVGLFFGEILLIVLYFVGLKTLFLPHKRTFIELFFSGLVAWTGVSIIKYLFPVARQFQALGTELLTLPVNPYASFPSGHAAVAFAIATTLWLHNYTNRKVWFGVAVLVAVGRVLLFVHYPIDVIVGALIGMLTSSVIYALYVQFSYHKSI